MATDCEWVGSWAASAQGPFFEGSDVSNFTIRQVVRATVGGNRVRVRFSNTFGLKKLLIGAAHIALHSSGPSIVPGVGPLTYL